VYVELFSSTLLVALAGVWVLDAALSGLGSSGPMGGRALLLATLSALIAGSAAACLAARRVRQASARAAVSVQANVAALSALTKDLQQARDAARAEERSKGNFLANVSHEIRTPMTAILGFMDILLDETDSSKASPQRLRLIADIHRNSDHLLSIINNILDLSSIEAGCLETRCVTSSPAEVVQDSLDTLRQRASEKDLELKYEAVGDLPDRVHTDPFRLRQILLNLVGNAIKFTEHGSVTVRLSSTPAPDAHLVCEVIDTGIGIDQQQHQQDQLFKPFTQIDSSHTRRFGGTGLGLTISSRLATLLGGSLDFQSKVGNGTTFVLRIPIRAATGEAPRLAEPSRVSVDKPLHTVPSGSAQTLSGRNLLLAEDGPDNRLIISHFLNRAGAHLEVVEDGRAAVDRVMESWKAGTPFDVVLMDIQMPVLDGLQATRELRKAGYRGAIVALTAHAMEGDRQACLDSGCDEYLTKPVDRAALVSRCVALSEHGQVRKAA
jgi:signal transduction histidine kinase/ActR/RegA family two-component response regulator